MRAYTASMLREKRMSAIIALGHNTCCAYWVALLLTVLLGVAASCVKPVMLPVAFPLLNQAALFPHARCFKVFPRKSLPAAVELRARADEPRRKNRACHQIKKRAPARLYGLIQKRSYRFLPRQPPFPPSYRPLTSELMSRTRLMLPSLIMVQPATPSHREPKREIYIGIGFMTVCCSPIRPSTNRQYGP